MSIIIRPPQVIGTKLPYCLDISPTSGRLCTRISGHGGRHHSVKLYLEPRGQLVEVWGEDVYAAKRAARRMTIRVQTPQPYNVAAVKGIRDQLRIDLRRQGRIS